MRSIVLATGLFIGTALTAQNAYLTNGFAPRYWKAATDYTINVRVRNSAVNPLFTFRVDWRWNSGPVQQGNVIGTTGITGGQYWPYVHPIAFNQPAGGGTLKVWAVGTGDTDPTNDTLRFTVDVLGAWATKSVLMEQFTGTWCQFCPDPNATTNMLDIDPLIVVAKHHNNDGLTNANSVAYWAQFNANYSPAGVMEQEEFGTLPDDAAYTLWQERAELRKLGVSPVAIGITAAFSEWTRLLTVDVDATFATSLNGDYVMNLYLLEDDVPGPQVAAAPGYIHHQVVREVLGGAGGTTGVIPATPTAGSTYSHQYTFAVPQVWNHVNMRVAATVTEVRSSGTHTVNTADAELVSVGMDEHDATLLLNAYPNPTIGALWLALRDASTPARVQVISTDGRSVIESSYTGSTTLRVERFESLAPGAYLVVVQQGDAVATQRVVRY